MRWPPVSRSAEHLLRAPTRAQPASYARHASTCSCAASSCDGHFGTGTCVQALALTAPRLPRRVFRNKKLPSCAHATHVGCGQQQFSRRHVLQALPRSLLRSRLMSLRFLCRFIFFNRFRLTEAALSGAGANGAASPVDAAERADVRQPGARCAARKSRAALTAGAASESPVRQQPASCDATTAGEAPQNEPSARCDAMADVRQAAASAERCSVAHTADVVPTDSAAPLHLAAAAAVRAAQRAVSCNMWVRPAVHCLRPAGLAARGAADEPRACAFGVTATRHSLTPREREGGSLCRAPSPSCGCVPRPPPRRLLITRQSCPTRCQQATNLSAYFTLQAAGTMVVAT